MAEGFRDIGRAVECGVCYNHNHYDTSARKPKVLTNCGHSLCRECVVGILSSNIIECPTCRSFTPLKTGDSDSLPTNYTVLSMMATLCSQCVDEKWISTCDLCKMNFCTGCQESHASDEVKDIRKALDCLEEVIRGANECKVKVESAVRDCEQVMKEKWKSLPCKTTSLSGVLKEITEATENIKAEICQMPQLLRQSCTNKTDSESRDSKPGTHLHIKGISQTKSNSSFDFFHALVLNILAAVGSAYASEAMDIPAANCIAFSKQSGNFFITSSTNDQIKVVNGNLQVLRNISIDSIAERIERESATGRFFGIATFKGSVYISDTVSDVVYCVKEDGVTLWKIGKRGSGPTEFRVPLGLACDTVGRLYVCDSQDERIQVLTSKGEFVGDVSCTVTENNTTYKCKPTHIAITQINNILVSDDEGNVHHFDYNGGHIWTQWAAKHPCMKANGIAVDNYGKMVISQTRGRILVSHESRNRICEIGATGQQVGELRDARGVLVSPNHDIIVCDSGNNRVQCFQRGRMGCLVILFCMAFVFVAMFVLYKYITMTSEPILERPKSPFDRFFYQ